MAEIKSKPSTDEYRENFDRIFRSHPRCDGILDGCDISFPCWLNPAKCIRQPLQQENKDGQAESTPDTLV